MAFRKFVNKLKTKIHKIKAHVRLHHAEDEHVQTAVTAQSNVCDETAMEEEQSAITATSSIASSSDIEAPLMATESESTADTFESSPSAEDDLTATAQRFVSTAGVIPKAPEVTSYYYGGTTYYCSPGSPFVDPFACNVLQVYQFVPMVAPTVIANYPCFPPPIIEEEEPPLANSNETSAVDNSSPASTSDESSETAQSSSEESCSTTTDESDSEDSLPTTAQPQSNHHHHHRRRRHSHKVSRAIKASMDHFRERPISPYVNHCEKKSCLKSSSSSDTVDCSSVESKHVQFSFRNEYDDGTVKEIVQILYDDDDWSYYEARDCDSVESYLNNNDATSNDVASLTSDLVSSYNASLEEFDFDSLKFDPEMYDRDSNYFDTPEQRQAAAQDLYARICAAGQKFGMEYVLKRIQ